MVAEGASAARSMNPEMTFLGFKVWEAIVRFESNSVSEVTFSLYNRGDAGEWTVGQFESFMGKLNHQLTAWAGDKGVQMRAEERTAAVTLNRKLWVRPPQQVEMIWSFTAKSKVQGTAAPRPEFARVQLTRFDPAHDPRKLVFATATLPGMPMTILDLRARVKQAGTGDVLIDSVPMVDQGQKGYCAAAVAERILRYYGRNVDEHEIAQLANTTAENGTNPDQMITALRRISGDLGLDVTVHEDFNLKDFEKLINDYNRAAHRVGRPELQYKTQIGNTIYIESPVVIYQQMDTALLKEVRIKRDAAMARFLTDIEHFINNGVPLAWAVMVGKLPEKPNVHLVGIGAHMRLIIGYNDRAKEILYTDTWGPGHEEKRMSLADAWTITLGLYSVQPSDIRF